VAPVSWLRGWGARRGNMDGRRMRLYKGAGRPGHTHMGPQNVRFYRDFGPQISMGAENFHGGGDPSRHRDAHDQRAAPCRHPPATDYTICGQSRGR
jgi:hypothetical protein